MQRVYGSALPTIQGIRAVLEQVGCSPKSSNEDYQVAALIQPVVCCGASGMGCCSQSHVGVRWGSIQLPFLLRLLVDMSQACVGCMQAQAAQPLRGKAATQNVACMCASSQPSHF